MTRELFRENAYLKSCDAEVVAVTASGGIILSETVFYPEGGGQPGDRGRLVWTGGEVAVVDTRKSDDGQLLHLTDESATLPAVGTRVDAAIDWDYRYRHMRTHTCLHLLCALIPHDVTGGSISQDKGRLDFDMSDSVDKPTLEQALNDLIDADHEVGFEWISDEEMSANMDLVRTMSVKPPMNQGRVRLISVKEIDLQPCGGTHVARTSEIGHVRIGKVEKKGKQNRRINIHLDDQ